MSLTRVTGIHCVHYIEQKDCTVQLGYMQGVYERFLFTALNQVYSRYTGRTVQGRAALSVLILYGHKALYLLQEGA